MGENLNSNFLSEYVVDNDLPILFSDPDMVRLMEKYMGIQATLYIPRGFAEIIDGVGRA